VPWQAKSTEAAPKVGSFSFPKIRAALVRLEELGENGQFKE
jgi:hypothetical protein